jgi:hypothetical protein
VFVTPTRPKAWATRHPASVIMVTDRTQGAAHGMNFDFDNLLSRQGSVGQSRSSVLNPLQWMTVIIIGGLASFVFEHAPSWLIIVMAILLCSTCALFAAAFVYFMMREPEALRSEDYSLAKHALDKGLFTGEIVQQILVREKEIQIGKGIRIKDAKELSEAADNRSLAGGKESR